MSLDAAKIRLIMGLRADGIVDMAVLAALERVPREAFVPAAFHDQAYENIALPIGNGQTISQPFIVALMTQALALSDRHRVLEIGTGSGYQTAVLARLCRRVYTVETVATLQAVALRRLEELKLRNVTARIGDGALGWPEAAPFDRIIVTAAAQTDAPPQALLDQMSEAGRMVIPLTDGPGAQTLYLLTKTEDGVEKQALCPVRFVPLVSDAPPARESA